MRLLVTGAEGQLAKSLLERAPIQELQIAAIGRPELDLERFDTIDAAFRRIRPDVVINAAAWTAVDEAEDASDRAFRINSEGAGEIAASAARIGARIVHISTDYVFDGISDRPYTEDKETNPASVYGRSKLAGEERVRAANPDHAIVRTAWLYSPFGRNFVKSMVAAASSRPVLKVVDDQCGSPSSAFDVADGLIGMLKRWRAEPQAGVGQIFHLAGGPPASWCAFARAIMEDCRTLGRPSAEIEPITTADWPTRAVRPRYSALDSQKFARTFGYAMPPWRESLSNVVERLTRSL